MPPTGYTSSSQFVPCLHPPTSTCSTARRGTLPALPAALPPPPLLPSAWTLWGCGTWSWWGPNYGVVFGAAAVVLSDGDANTPSPPDYVAMDSGKPRYMTVAWGFTGLSFQYSLAEAGGAGFLDFYVYDGPNATGTVLETAQLPLTSLLTWRTHTSSLVAQVAKSIQFGMAGTPLLDDVSITLVSLPQGPTAGPTKAPTTAAPSKAPQVQPPACAASVYWVYNAANNAPLRRLVNNSVTCLAHPYSIEVRPCGDGGGANGSVSMRLVRLVPGRRRTVVIHRRIDADAPYYLFGDAAGDVLPSPASLPNGNYQLLSTIDSGVAGVGGGWGKATTVLAFTQSCAPPPPPPPCLGMGKKGCAMMMMTKRALSNGNQKKKK
jgi:hypothetical protein